MNKILITGAAGFIGFHLAKRLLDEGREVIGIDNINNYYDVNLKFGRLKELGIIQEKAEKYNHEAQSDVYPLFKFIRINLEDRENLPLVFKRYNFSVVCNLAAQAGVRYSIENPEAYVDSNVTGFLNILECCRNHTVEHLVYASSSSVYGQNEKVPFSVDDNVDHPISLYAATKKSNELMSYTYSHLYDFRTTGLRFFTVYGPWGRPDMAMFLFTDAIIKGKPIKVFNRGNLERDFTFIDDIVEGVAKVIDRNHIGEKYNLYNIGNNKPVKLLNFIEEIEKNLGIEAKKELLPMQPGDVNRTWADIDSFKQFFNYNPATSIQQGVQEYVVWHKKYYCKK